MRPTNKEVSIAIDIIDKLMSVGLYDALTYHKINSDKEYYRLGLSDWLEGHRELLRAEGIDYSWGQTKLCLLCDVLDDWVIKLGFLRSTDPYYVKEGLDKDFCNLEAEYYVKACDNNLGEFFAATYEVGEINGVHIFLQELAQPDEDYFMDCFEEYARQGNDRDDFDNDEQYDDYIDDIVEDMDNDERIYAVFGEESDNLVNFIDMFEINDLHEANYGLTKDGRAVIFDFSGYCG